MYVIPYDMYVKTYLCAKNEDPCPYSDLVTYLKKDMQTWEMYQRYVIL